jgi:type IV pilus assembly protein PilQ
VASLSPAAQSITTGATPAANLADTTFTTRTEFNAAVPAGGFTFGIIKDQVSLFIRALEEITDSEILANPKVLVLNKQIGNVIVGRRDGYLTTTVTETQAIQEVEFLETGTQLTFRPFVSSDGYVRMELHPEDSVGGLTPAQLPFEQTTEVTTSVLVRDGHTILIGGLFREVASDTRSQVPLLGDLPLIGNLFRSRSDVIEREEVIILLTVHIVKNDADYARYSSEQLQDLERTRVGLRRGMMWHGRDRLAQSYYRTAIKLFAQGEDGRALWSVQIALHNQPRFMSAIKLKEEIAQAREWDDEGALTRSFIRDLIRGERGEEAPPFGRPAPPLRREEGDAADHSP